MPLGTEVGLSLGEIVLDGDQAAPPLKGQSPTSNFGPMSFVAKLLDGLRCHLVWRLASTQASLCSMGTQIPPEKKGTAPPNFWPMSIVAKWLDGSRCHLVIGMEVDLGAGYVLLDGVPALRERDENRVRDVKFLVPESDFEVED